MEGVQKESSGILIVVLIQPSLISGFRHDGDELCALLGYYSDSWLCLACCPETSVNNYHTTPRNIPEECRP
jgi:hypothetical protein